MMRRLEYGFGVWLDEKSCELVFENGVSCEVCKEKRFGEMKHLAYEEDEAADGRSVTGSIRIYGMSRNERYLRTGR